MMFCGAIGLNPTSEHIKVASLTKSMAIITGVEAKFNWIRLQKVSWTDEKKMDKCYSLIVLGVVR